MKHSVRNVAVLCCWGWVTMGVGLHGCSSRLGPVRAIQNGGSIDRANLPDISVEQSKECVAEYASQMAPGRIVVLSAIQVNEDGDKVGVRMEGIPMTANDFGACLRNVLRDLPIAEKPFEEAVRALRFYRKHAMDSQDALERFIEAIPGVPIVESELVLEADGYTVEFNVTVDVVTKMETLVDGDKRTLETLGKLAIVSIGYDEIMRRAEEQGWIKTVPDEQATSTVDKRFIGDVSISPSPQPPLRPPPPPPTGVIVKTATKRIVTRAAPTAVARVLPTALARAAPTALAPGVGEIIAVGTIAVTLIEFGVLKPEDILGGGQAHGSTISGGVAGAAVGGAIGTTAVTPTTTAPVATGVKPRKYPNQTCEDDEMARLEKWMHENFCDKGYAATCGGGGISAKKLPFIPCSTVKLSLQQRQACLAARWKVQNECFGGKPDKKHKDEIDNVQRGVDHCEALKLKNCAKGHPMANL